MESLVDLVRREARDCRGAGPGGGCRGRPAIQRQSGIMHCTPSGSSEFRGRIEVASCSCRHMGMHELRFEGWLVPELDLTAPNILYILHQCNGCTIAGPASFVRSLPFENSPRQTMNCHMEEDTKNCNVHVTKKRAAWEPHAGGTSELVWESGGKCRYFHRH